MCAVRPLLGLVRSQSEKFVTRLTGFRGEFGVWHVRYLMRLPGREFEKEVRYVESLEVTVFVIVTQLDSETHVS